MPYVFCCGLKSIGWWVWPLINLNEGLEVAPSLGKFEISEFYGPTLDKIELDTKELK